MIFHRSELWINGADIFFILFEGLNQGDELSRAALLPRMQLLLSVEEYVTHRSFFSQQS